MITTLVNYLDRYAIVVYYKNKEILHTPARINATSTNILERLEISVFDKSELIYNKNLQGAFRKYCHYVNSNQLI